MTAALRCCCGRCAGGVIFLTVPDYLAAHQLAPGEYVLDSEVAVDDQYDEGFEDGLAGIHRDEVTT